MPRTVNHLFSGPKRKYSIKVITDLTAILTIGLPVLFLFLLCHPYQRGFNCDDESIRYPFKENTISSFLCTFYSIAIPVITISIIETGWFLRSDQNRLHRPLPALVWQIYTQLSPLAFGAVLSQMMTDIAKYSIGRLRPHFIDVCHPRLSNGDIITLSQPGDCHKYPFQYLEDFTCSNPRFTETQMRDSRLSFMSGHSSISFFGLLYCAIYLQQRLKWNSVGFVRPLFQALCIYLAFYTAMSRISDYKHHWSDVLVGSIQGVLVAIFTAFYISDMKTSNPNNTNTSIIAPSGTSHHVNIHDNSIDATLSHQSYRSDHEERSKMTNNPTNYSSCAARIEMRDPNSENQSQRVPISSVSPISNEVLT